LPLQILFHASTSFVWFTFVVNMQVSPSPYLAQVVKHFLVLESDVQGTTRHRLFPDGNPGMVFQYSDSLTSFANSSARSFLYGQVSGFHTIISDHHVRLLIVVLQPYGAHALTGIPAHELTDNIIPLQLLWGSRAGEQEERIAAMPGNLERIGLIERFLLQQLTRVPMKEGMIQQIISLIHHHQGCLPVAQLSSTLHINERQLERKFREHIGITPKQFSGIVRLQHFLKQLRYSDTDIHLTRIAYDCGYYDQAHLIREFRKHTGITPRQYIAAANPLALNFIQLSH
jgi:AraC-like DNA-binding protein